MAKYPIRIKLKPIAAAAKPAPKAPKAAKPTPSYKEPTQADLDRHSRMQALEQRDAEIMMRQRKSSPQVIRTTVNERTTPQKKK
jgi:hypothetical protein